MLCFKCGKEMGKKIFCPHCGEIKFANRDLHWNESEQDTKPKSKPKSVFTCLVLILLAIPAFLLFSVLFPAIIAMYVIVFYVQSFYVCSNKTSKDTFNLIVVVLVCIIGAALYYYLSSQGYLTSRE